MKRISYIIGILLFSLIAKAQNTTIQNRAKIDWQNIQIFSGGVRIGTLAGASFNAIVVVDANGNLDTIPTTSVSKSDAEILTLVRANVDTSGTYTDALAIAAARANVSLDDAANVNDTTDNKLAIINYTDISGQNILMSLIGDTINNLGSQPVTTLLLKGNRSAVEFKTELSDGRIINLGTALALITDNSGNTIQMRPNGVTQITFNANSGIIAADELSLGSNFLNFGANEPLSSVFGTTRIYSDEASNQRGLLKIDVKKAGLYTNAVTIDSTRSVRINGAIKDTSGSSGLDGQHITSTGTGFYWTRGNPSLGWASYTGNLYTSVSPLVIAEGDTATLYVNNSSVINTYLPIDVDSLWNRADSTLIGVDIGVSYDVRIGFRASSNATAGRAELIFQLGNGVILNGANRNIGLSRGSGIAQPVGSSTSLFSLTDFINNGCKVRVYSESGATSIWDINIFIKVDTRP